nr:hypothetical protein BgiMline_016487 [Biomphalaria glabrata]
MDFLCPSIHVGRDKGNEAFSLKPRDCSVITRDKTASAAFWDILIFPQSARTHAITELLHIDQTNSLHSGTEAHTPLSMDANRCGIEYYPQQKMKQNAVVADSS